MLSRLRKFIGEFKLRKELSKVKADRKIINFQEARKMGIIYMLEDVPLYETISNFVAELQHDHKEVKALGFVKNKDLVSRFLPKLSFDFFSSHDINYFYKPRHPKVSDFIDTDFDILIDLSLTEQLPLKYISGLSKAHCRVGRYSEKDKMCYDLMLDIPPGTVLTEYMHQIVHYLKIINKNGERKQ